MASRQRRVVWSRGALGELDEAISHIAVEAPSAARALLEQLLEAASSLETMSERGRIVPERDDPTIREILVSSFRLVYSVQPAQVVVLGLVHQRRDFERWRDAR